MTRYTYPLNANKFAAKRFKSAQGTLYALKTGMAAATRSAMKLATTPIQYVAKKANNVLNLQKLKGVNNRKK